MAKKAKQVVQAYTDGACEGNPGPGGFGVIYYLPGEEPVELAGAHRHTTNNQMELMAVITLLETLPEDSDIELYTDSRYVMDGSTKWMPNWKKRNWRLKSGGAVKNAGLWRRLDNAVNRHHLVNWHWVRGHAGNHGNERADELAYNAIKRLQRGEIEPVSLEEDAAAQPPPSSPPPASPSSSKKQPSASRKKKKSSRAANKPERDLFSGTNSDPPQLVLASTSPYRRAQLERLGVPFESAAPGVDEDGVKAQGYPPVELVRTLARLKAEALAARYPHALLIGGDQAVMFAGRLLGKPGTPARAVEQLLELAGNTHHLLTAMALHDTRSGETHAHLDVHEMTMRPLTLEQAHRYVEHDQTQDCAGAYKIESRGIALFERIHGDDATAVQGLPMIWLTGTLIKLGLDPADAWA